MLTKRSLDILFRVFGIVITQKSVEKITIKKASHLE